MAKLPDETSLGGRPAPRAVRPIQGTSGLASGAAQSVGALTRFSQSAGEGLQRIADAALTMQTRDDAVERARDVTEFTRTVNEEFLRLQTEKDFSRNETGREFVDYVKKRKSDIINNHRGSASSKAALLERVEALSGRFIDNAAVYGLQAKQVVVSTAMTDSLNSLTANVYNDPSSLTAAIEKWNTITQDMAPALSPEDEERYRSMASDIVKSAASSFLDKGYYAEARKVLDTPSFKELINPDTGLNLRARIASQEEEGRRRQKNFLKDVREIESLQGFPITPDQKEALIKKRLGGDGPMTLQEKIGELNELGIMLTPDQVEKMAGVYMGEYTPFGSGTQARSAQTLMNLAPGFSAGTLTPEQGRMWDTAMALWLRDQPTERLNPDTGVWERFEPVVPDYVVEAYRQRGTPPPAQQTGQIEPPAEPAIQTPSAQQTELLTEPAVQEMPQGKTIWGLAEKATGPVPAIGEALHRTPVVGGFVGSAEMTQARQYIPLVQRDLIRVLQNNPRYAEGERKAIEAEINIKPEFWDRPEAFRDRLIAIDDALIVRQKNALAASENPNIGREERVHAKNVYSALVDFRESLGIPQRVYVDKGSPKNNPDFNKLEPGTPFLLIYPDGRVESRTKAGETDG